MNSVNACRAAAIVGALALACAGLARAEIEWRGTLTETSGTSFALFDTSTGASKWVGLHGNFDSYSVDNYDAERQTLVLTKPGTHLQLTPSDAHVVAPAPVRNELTGLRGMALADAIARRGDKQMQDLLEQHRKAVLAREEMARRILAQERQIKAIVAQNAGGAASNSGAAAEAERELNRLRGEAAAQDAIIIQRVNTITRLAEQKRSEMGGAP